MCRVTRCRKDVPSLESFYPFQVNNSYFKNTLYIGYDSPNVCKSGIPGNIFSYNKKIHNENRNTLFSGEDMCMNGVYPYDKYLIQRCAVKVFSKKVMDKCMIVSKINRKGLKKKRRIRFIDNTLFVYSMFGKKSIPFDSIVLCYRNVSNVTIVTQEFTIVLDVGYITIAMSISLVLGKGLN